MRAVLAAAVLGDYAVSKTRIAGGGYSRQPDGMVWDGEIFAMAVMPSFQNITTFRTNNTGENLSSSATDFFAGRRQTGLSRYVGVGLPGRYLHLPENM